MNLRCDGQRVLDGRHDRDQASVTSLRSILAVREYCSHYVQDRILVKLARHFVAVTLAVLPFLAACTGETAPAENTPADTRSVVAASDCVDADAKNFTSDELAETGLSSTEPGWKDMIDPILTRVPAGGYANLVRAVCDAVPTMDTEMQEWKKTRGKFALQGVLACIEASGAGGKATVQFFLDRTAQFYSMPTADGNSESNRQHRHYLDTYWPAVAEYYCPHQFQG